jgi:CrcB protein
MSLGFYLGLIAAAAVGAMLQHLFAELGNADLPVGTLVVNLVASFVMGLVAAKTDSNANIAFQVGLLGTMSTWSTLAHEVASLARNRRAGEATVYLLISVVLGVLAAWMGLRIGS